MDLYEIASLLYAFVLLFSFVQLVRIYRALVRQNRLEKRPNPYRVKWNRLLFHHFLIVMITFLRMIFAEENHGYLFWFFATSSTPQTYISVFTRYIAHIFMFILFTSLIYHWVSFASVLISPQPSLSQS